MKILVWAEFTSSLPEDQIEDDEDVLQYGGKSVAEAIAEVLAGFGCVVPAPPTHAGEHGWECSFQFKGRNLWFQVTLIEGYILTFEDVSWFDKMRGRTDPRFIEFMRAVGPALGGDERFQDLRWVESDDVLTGAKGAASPVID